MSGGFEKLFIEHELEKEQAKVRAEDMRRAQAAVFQAEAYRHMPEDLKTTAAAFGCSNFMQLVWMNAWENGYKQAMRDQKDAAERQKHDG